MTADTTATSNPTGRHEKEPHGAKGSLIVLAVAV
jgi:hypothetical protein